MKPHLEAVAHHEQVTRSVSSITCPSGSSSFNPADESRHVLSLRAGHADDFPPLTFPTWVRLGFKPDCIKMILISWLPGVRRTLHGPL